MTNLKETMKECVDEAVEVFRGHMPPGTEHLTKEEAALAIQLYIQRRF